MIRKLPENVSQYLAKIGAKGGRNGKGKPKTRPEGYYSAIGKKGGRPKKVLEGKRGEKP